MMALAVAAVIALPAAATLLPGVYSNEEQVYFAREAGKPPPTWLSIRITLDGDGFRLQPVDAFGVAVADAQRLRVREGETITTITSGACVRDFARVPLGLTVINSRGRCDDMATLSTVLDRGIVLTTADGVVLDMQRSRSWRCWASMPRAAKKPDGSVDWWFKPGLMLHDAGGRVAAVTDDATPQAYTLRMRNVAWPSGPNQPSVVVYVHAADPEHAIGYGWADPGARRIGVNLRSVQASCSLVEAGAAR